MYSLYIKMYARELIEENTTKKKTRWTEQIVKVFKWRKCGVEKLHSN